MGRGVGERPRHQNDLYGSPTGLEITVSKDIKATKNDIHDNTVGVGLYHPAAAGLPRPGRSDRYGNWVSQEPHPQQQHAEHGRRGRCPALPPGLGVLILGVDRVNVEKNEIEGNDFVGVAVIDWCVAAAERISTATPIRRSFQYTAPDNNLVMGNIAGNNGGNPPPGDLRLQLLSGRSWRWWTFRRGSTVLLPPGTRTLPGRQHVSVDNEPVVAAGGPWRATSL